MMARNKNIHSQSNSNLKKSHSKSMAIKIADSAIIDLVQPPLVSLHVLAEALVTEDQEDAPALPSKRQKLLEGAKQVP